MRILFLTIDLASNATGRTYVLWLLARKLGWTTDVVAPSGETVWGPVADSEFASVCRVLTDSENDAGELLSLAGGADLIVAVKPLPGAYDRALRLQRATGTPLLLDIDDPSIEARVPLRDPLRLLGLAILRPKSFWPVARLYRAAKHEQHKIVSNPVLQQRWGGDIVPHAREDSGAGVAHARSNPEVVFVGTNHVHKGISTLREAVSMCQDLGVRLIVTDTPPADARPWERWVGRTSLEAGFELVRNGDIVALPSIPGRAFADAQLPAKIIDAMLAGRAVVVSDLAPLVWALDGTGIVADEYTPSAFASAIRALAAPQARAPKGAAARTRALGHFSVEAVTPVFEAACIDATSASIR
ncbi:glycosyltransferase [Microbacterium tumbae]